MHNKEPLIITIWQKGWLQREYTSIGHHIESGQEHQKINKFIGLSKVRQANLLGFWKLCKLLNVISVFGYIDQLLLANSWKGFDVIFWLY
ncbi:hypothetical protein AQUCO_00200077v1 [Aquilegia coerulea]|uniref:Uncharacterized protein n=1 Tax=Aquilegia coerulea TaxID=218851 RepID=A0A2G5F1Q8_AQUCA|nr:hypothetical protein AQUCO_00200077v1 [Aquilegia coerulea]